MRGIPAAWFLTFVILISSFVISSAATPNLLNHQGRIAVNGTNFEGTGLFKFALVNAAGSTTYWSNDGTSTAGSQPTAAVSLPVVKGLYAVLLGDSALANMTTLPASVFDNADVRLRVWFNDGTLGFQQITPDQRLAAAPYSLNAAKAESVPDASITSAKLAADLTLPGTTTGSFSGSLTGTFSGNGSALTSLNATSLASGTLGDARLSTNVALLDRAAQNFTGSTNSFAGNIGIGTTSPSTRLHVFHSGVTPPATTGSTQAAGQIIRLRDGGGVVLDIGGAGGAGYWFQSSLQSDLAATFPLLLNPVGGNVGIGMGIGSGPVTKLDIKGSGSALPATTGGDQSAGHIVRLRDSGSNVLDIGSAGSSGIWLQPTSFGNVSNTWPLLLNPNGGNVGIGVTAASARLHVGGNARFNSTVTLSAGTTTIAPLVLQSGTNLTTPVFGSVEFDGTNLYLTNNSGTPTRKTLAFTDSAISGSQIANGTITSAMLASGAVTSDKVATGSIGSAQLASSAVQSSNIAAGAVTNTQMAANAINAANLATGVRSGTTMDGVMNFSTPGSMSSTLTFSPPLNATPTLTPAPGWSFTGVSPTSFTATHAFTSASVTTVGSVTSSTDTFLTTVVSGRPAIAYHDNTGARIKYAVAPNADGSGTWTVVDIGGTPGGSNLARISLVTIGGIPFIAYRASSLTLARASTADGTGTWTNITVPGAGLGNHASLAEVNGKPAIGYNNGGGSNLRYAFNSAADGSGTWTVVVVDSANGSGIHTSLVVVNGQPAISYRDSTNNLAFVRASNASGSTWGTPVALDLIGSAGGWTSMKIIDGRPAISYYDANTGDLKFIRATDADGTAWLPPVTIDSTGTVGTYTSLSTVNGRPAISYYEQTGANLKFAYCSTVDGSGTWTVVTVETTGTVGQSTSLAVVNGGPAISYFDNTNSLLKYASIPVLNWNASEFGVAGPIAASSFTGNLVGNAATATVSTSFSGNLAGDVTGTQAATNVMTVGGVSAANVASGATLANAATSANTPSTLVLRDASGNFSAGTITGTFVGNGAGLTGVNISSVIAPPVKPVVAWGDNDNAQITVPSTLSNANTAAIAAGGSTSVALLKTGTVVQWGSGAAVPGGLINVTHIAAGADHRLARKSDGTVTAWGDNAFGQATVPGGLTTATNIAAGEKHSLALRADGTVLAWGDNTFSQTTVPGTATSITAIAAGADHSLVLKADGTVVAWGRNDSGQVTGTYPSVGVIAEIINSTTYRLSTTLAIGTTDLRYDGSTVISSTGDGSDIVTVASTTGLTAGMTVTRSNLVGPTGLTNVVAIACGAYHSLAVKSDGTVVAWGWDSGGQVAGATGLTGVSKVAGGYAFSLALKNDGTLVAWGDNSDGQLTIPTSAMNVTAIACGLGHALALRADLIPAQVARLDQDNVFTGKVGIQRTPATNNLEVEGQASKTTAGNWLANSDRRIKTEVQPITGAVEKLSKVNLVDFKYTADYMAAHPGIEDKRYLNVIAQEFAEVFPNDVKSSGETLPDGSPILQVDTYPLTIYSAAAVQELARENEKLKKQLAEQEERLRKLEEALK